MVPPHDDVDIARQFSIEIRITGIDVKTRESEELISVRDDDDVIDTDGPQDLWRELLVAAAEDETVPSEWRHDDDSLRMATQ